EVKVVATAYTLAFSLTDDTEYAINSVSCRNSTGKETKANEANVCESLNPCTFFTCVVAFRSNVPETQAPADQTIYAYTEYKQPKTTLTSVVPTANSIKIVWETTDRACVEYFEITAEVKEVSYNTKEMSDTSTYTFKKDIRACRTHRITLLTRNNASLVVDEDYSEVDTLYSEPGDLGMNVANLANGITIVTWDDPVEKYCISNYVFKWRRNDCGMEVNPGTTTTEPSTMTTFDVDDDTGITEEPSAPTKEPTEGSEECDWTDTSSDGMLREYLLTDLQGCEPHTFEVFINENKTAKGSEVFTSAEKRPSVVFEPQLSSESTQLTWTWSAPQDHPKCVYNYFVNLTGPSQRPVNTTTELETAERTAIFASLDPCGVYNVEIVPIMFNGTSGSKYQAEGTVSEDQPSPIIEPIVLAGPTSLELSWMAPAYADLCVDGYRLSGWTEDDQIVDVKALSVTTQNTSVSFENLPSCQMYILQIIPYTREKLDGELKQIEAETEAAVVAHGKVIFEPTSVGSHSVDLSAYNNDFNNTCQTIYALFKCSTSENVPHQYAERYVEGHSRRGFKATLSPLSPYTTYLCNVIFYNVAGASQAVPLANLKTSNYFPERPTHLQNNERTSHSLQFSWDPPDYLNGALKFYQVFLMRHMPDYFVPEDCTFDEWSKSETNPLNSSNYTALMAGMQYMIQVAAQNDFGMGDYTVPLIGITLPSVSENVTQLTVTPMGPYPDPSLEYFANVTITWTVPCRSNGEIEYFLLDFSGERASYDPVNFQRQVQLDMENKKGRMSYTETEMLPEYKYKVQVAVKNLNVAELSGGVAGQWQSPAGLPPRLGADLVGQMRIKTDETNHPTRSAVVRLPADIMNSESGQIQFVALLLSQKNCGEQPELGFDVSSDWPNSLTYELAGGDGAKGCVLQYQTTPDHWQPVLSSRSRSYDYATASESDMEIVFTIGEDKCPNGNRYCNGPLLADTEYHLVVRLFTSAGYSDAALLDFKTEAAIKVTLIVVSVCSCLVLAFVLGLVILWVRKRIAWHRDSGQGIEDPFGNVIAKNFAIFYAEVAKPEKLAREFKEITVVALELSYAASELGCHKNRYADIYPYDKNRVILDIDAEGSDYINASFIDGHTRKKEYIATQGPKPESLMDFWRMVLQYNVRVIVQVTQFREGNTVINRKRTAKIRTTDGFPQQIKCHEYFPYTMRGLTVTVKNKEAFELYDRTEMTVVHDKYGLKEKVVHFFFKKWPDHGVPEDPLHLINFVKKVKAERRPSYSPIVVHCSAGVGRTGTFIGLDLIMQRLKSESKINIFETVKKLRFQRMKMVQTQQQYTFLYACTYELVKHKIPRAALRLEGRPKSISTVPPLSAPKKVSFPDVDVEARGGGCGDAAVAFAPDPSARPLPLPARYTGQRKSSPSFDSDDVSTSM
ncbi:hypothetical protein KR018_003744, partial [Drosophila ironensis]